MRKQKIAIIGIGSIGQTIAKEMPHHLRDYYELVGLMKHSPKRIEELEAAFNVPVVTQFSKLLETEPDFVIEAAGVDVVKDYGEAILE